MDFEYEYLVLLRQNEALAYDLNHMMHLATTYRDFLLEKGMSDNQVFEGLHTMEDGVSDPLTIWKNFDLKNRNVN